ncbi:MAG: SDR family oxidoreductase [Chloroflexi bacterium]|nr:SDR family oxidoreductase [Chloroflexota bacterium]
MNLELTGKKALITGGSRGIGKAIARELALEGVDVAIAARGMDALNETARELSAEIGGKIIPIAIDTGDEQSIRDAVNSVSTELGGIDILINNAAIPGGGPAPTLESITLEAFDADMHVKVMGYIRCAQAVAPIMRESRWGRIINISGMAARQVGSTIGSMRNVAVVAMARNLAAELGPDGITVNVIHPGMTRTERTPGMLEARAKADGTSLEEAEAAMSRGNNVGRIIDAREIAYVATFLASPRSGAITGDVIAAGGGVGNAIWY